MKKTLVLLLLIIAANNLFSQQNTKIFFRGDSVSVYDNRIIVKVAQGNEGKFADFLKKNLDLQQVAHKHSDKYKLLKVKEGKLDAVIQRLSKNDLFEYVEPDIICTVDLTTPNDQYYTAGEQYAIDRINLRDAWDIATGSGSVLVQILDTGIPMNGSGLSHPDLNSTSKYILGENETPDTTGVKDENGHGTHVLGIAGAMSNNTTGIVGVNWGSRFRMSKVFQSDGTGSATYFYDGVIDAVDNGANIINYSGGSSVYSSLQTDAANYAKDHNVLLVFSAGNANGGSVNYPGALASSFDNVIAVSSTDANNNFSSFSSKGPAVSVSAPGTGIFSTMPNYSVYLTNYKGHSQNYDYMDGTSMAAPYVTGVASLMKSANSNLSPGKIKEILQNTALDLGSYGKDDYYGYGKINAFRAVRASQILLNYPTAKFISKPKSSGLILDADTYQQTLGGQVYLVKRYRMDVTFDLSQYLTDPSQSLVWYNSNGISNANPNYSTPPWYQIISQNGNLVTVRTYDYEMWNIAGNYLGWWTDPASLSISLLAYGVEKTAPPLTASISGPSYLNKNQSGTWVVTASGGVPPYTYSWSVYVYCTIPYISSKTTANNVVTPDALPCDQWMSIYNTTNTETYSETRSFQLKCIVKDAVNSSYTVTKDVSVGSSPLEKKNADSVLANIKELINKESLVAYPNPFNPTTRISFSLENTGYVSLKIFDILGKEVKTLIQDRLDKGIYEYEFNGSSLPSGIYICNLTAGNKTVAKKILLAK